MQLTRIQDFNSQSIIFNDAKEYRVKDSKIKYKRIPIETVYPDGKKGSLVIETLFLFSFGVNEKRNQDTNKLVGYSIPVCLWEKDGTPSLEEEMFYAFFVKLTELCQRHLEDEFGPDVTYSLSEPLYYKQVEYTDKKGKKKTKRDTSSAPIPYAKVIYSEKTKKIISLFRTKGKEKVNPFNYLNQYCNVKMALIIEGVFISKTVTSIQIKVHECYIKPLKPRESLLTIGEETEGSEAIEAYDKSETEESEIEDYENVGDYSKDGLDKTE